MMAKRIAFAILALVLLLGLEAGFWMLTYPDAADPKNLKYVLWKHGLYHLDPPSVLAALGHDAEANKIVLGRSRKEVEAMLGPLVPIEGPHYIASCWAHSPWPEDHIFFVDNEFWFYVVFENDRAVGFGIAKGC